MIQVVLCEGEDMMGQHERFDMPDRKHPGEEFEVVTVVRRDQECVVIRPVEAKRDGEWISTQQRYAIGLEESR